MMFDILYVSGHYYDKIKKIEIEKTKTYTVFAENEKEAEEKFAKEINKKFISIQQSKGNTLGDLHPILQTLRSQYK